MDTGNNHITYKERKKTLKKIALAKTEEEHGCQLIKAPLGVVCGFFTNPHKKVIDICQKQCIIKNNK